MTDISRIGGAQTEEDRLQAWEDEQRGHALGLILASPAAEAYRSGSPVFACDPSPENSFKGATHDFLEMDAAIRRDLPWVRRYASCILGLTTDLRNEVEVSVGMFYMTWLDLPLFQISLRSGRTETPPERDWYSGEWHDSEGWGVIVDGGERIRMRSRFSIPLDVIAGPEEGIFDAMREGVIAAVAKLDPAASS
jgi:hypothetical protein